MKGCQTLRLGTLFDYAAQDPEFAPWADPNEGTRKGSLEGNFIGDELKPFGIVSGKGGLSFRNCRYSNRSLNCYMFCTSLDPSNPGIYPTYDSCYQIFNPAAMAAIITDLLWQQLAFNNLDVPISELRPSCLGIECEHRKVQYFSDGELDIKENNVNTIAELNAIHPPHFSKLKEYNNKNYEKEQEYRFCFHVFDKFRGIRLPVKKEPKILDVSTLSAYCSLLK